MDDNVRLLTKVATLYYRNRETQEAIAARLGLSRQTVGRYLKRAEEQGIVEIHIQSPLLFATELENRLEEAFGLAEAIVVVPPADTDEAVKEALGEAAAAFLQRRVHNGDIIGVSWSSTLLECARHLERGLPRRVTVVQMNGSMDRSSYSTRAEYIIDRIARAFGGEAVTLVVPMLVERIDIKTSLLSDSRIVAALDMAGRANVALFGVGDVSERSSLYNAGYVDDTMLARLRAAGAVGDICGRFYDVQGRPCISEINERTLAVELETLRSKALSVAVAGTARKVDAILGALRGRYCNVLITDEEAARALITRKELG